MESDHQPLAERSVLALMIEDDRARRRAFGEGLTTDHFPRHRAIFEALQSLHRAGAVIDPATVAEAAKVFSDPGTDTSETVERLVAAKPAHDGWTAWVGILRRSLALRIALDGSRWLAEASEADQATQTAQSVLEALTDALSGPSASSTIKEAAATFLVHLKELAARGDMPGLPTGIHQLDGISGGMRPGELWTTLAKTSRGKTVLMLQIAAHAAYHEEKKVAVFSAEMMTHELVARFVANLGDIDLSKVLQPAQWHKYERDKVTNAVQRVADIDLWLDDTPGLTMRHIENESQRLADAHDGLDLCVVDYIQIIKGERGRNESREQEVARISGALKQLAKRLGCPVLTAAQLNKDGESRETQSIAFDSDAMLFIADDGIKVGKLRNGRRDDTLPLRLNGALQRFETFTPTTNERPDTKR